MSPPWTRGWFLSPARALAAPGSLPHALRARALARKQLQPPPPRPPAPRGLNALEGPALSQGWRLVAFSDTLPTRAYCYCQGMELLVIALYFGTNHLFCFPRQKRKPPHSLPKRSYPRALLCPTFKGGIVHHLAVNRQLPATPSPIEPSSHRLGDCSLPSRVGFPVFSSRLGPEAGSSSSNSGQRILQKCCK